MMRRAKFLTIVTFVAWAALVASALAGTYDVVSCGAAPGNINNAWTAVNNTPSSFTTSTVCPAGSDQYGGLRAFDTLGGPSVAPGASAEWRFTAPAGTTITRWRYDRLLGKYADPDWTVYGKLGDGTVIDSCDFSLPADECRVPPPGESGFRDERDISTDKLVFGFSCDTAPGFTCVTGATLHHVWASIYSSTVTLTENSLPTVGLPSGSLVTGSGWHQGTESVSFSASDSSPGVGVKETRVYIDDVLRGSVAHTCDYTLTIPCADPPGQILHSVDTTAVADGERPVEVAAVDAAGNERRGVPVNVRFDNNPPADLSVVANALGSQITVSWSAGDGAGSGAQSYDLEVSDTGAPYEPWLAATTQTSATYTGAPGGNYFFRMRARDHAGHLSGYVASGQIVVPPIPPGATPVPPTPGTPAPPDGGGAPTGSGDSERATPTLRLGRVRRGTRLLVVGAVEPTATGEVAVTYAARVRGRARRLTRTVEIRRARFRALLPLPRAIRNARRGILTVRYSGDANYRPRTVRTVVTR